MTTSLPPVPNLDQIKHQARDLLKAAKAGDAAAMSRLKSKLPRPRKRPRTAQASPADRAFKLSDAQLAVAREYGFASWPLLAKHVSDFLKKDEQRKAIAQATADVAAAAQRGDLPRLRSLLVERPALVSALHGEFGRPPLHVAAIPGHMKVVRWLLDHGADPNQRDKGDNALALHFAAGEGHLDIVKLLVERGADINASGDDHEIGVIGWATCFRQVRRDVAEYLLSQGAKHNIFSAISMNDADTVRRLVKADRAELTRPMSHNEAYRPPLYQAVACDLPEMVKLLIELGADVNARDKKGRSPIDFALRAGKVQAYRVLEARGGRPDAALLASVGPIEVTAVVAALSAAIRSNDLAAVRRIVAAEPSVATRKLQEPFYEATTQGGTALHWAAWEGRREIAAFLLDHGADINARDDTYFADPAGWAEENHQAELLDFFIERGCDSAVIHAARLGRIDLLKACLKKNPDISRFPGTPLHAAVEGGQAEAIKVMLAAGIDVNTGNIRGVTALHVAAHLGDVRLCRLLLKYGADPNAAAKDGDAPLAAAAGAPANGATIASLLITAGADVHHKDHQGHTALRHATDAKNAELADLLRKHGVVE